MGIGNDMHEYNMKEIREWCKKKKLRPGKIIGTSTGVMLTDANNKRFKVISFDEFDKILKEKKLAVFGTKEGWMKIMKII
jgi:hypothetical protein